MKNKMRNQIKLQWYLPQATNLDVRLRWSLVGGGRLQEVLLIAIWLMEEPSEFWLGGRSERFHCTCNLKQK